MPPYFLYFEKQNSLFISFMPLMILQNSNEDLNWMSVSVWFKALYYDLCFLAVYIPVAFALCLFQLYFINLISLRRLFGLIKVELIQGQW